MISCALDVGAHWGEVMLDYAREHPDVPVFAFEPDVRDAARIAVALNNYHVFAVAIDEVDAVRELRINRVPGCSSLHAPDPEGLLTWPGGRNFAEVGRLWVPTMRLDTFLGHMQVERVLWLKIDTQGHDLAVIHSLGKALACVEKITVEVFTTARGQYADMPSRQAVIDYLTANKFTMTTVETQTSGAEENLTFER